MSKSSSKAINIWLKAQGQAASSTLGRVVLLGNLNALFLVVQAGLVAFVVQELLTAKTLTQTSQQALLVLLLVIALRALMQYLKEQFAQEAGRMIRSQLRVNLLQNLTQLGPKFIQQQSAADLTTSMIERVDALQDYYAKFRPQMTLIASVPLILLAFIFPVDYLAGLVLLGIFPLVPVAMALVGMRAEKANRQNFRALGRLSHEFLDALQGLATLKRLGQTTAQQQKMATAADEYRQGTMAVLRIAFLTSASLEFFFTLAFAALALVVVSTLGGDLHWGVGWVDFSLGFAIFVLLLVPEFFTPLREFSAAYHAKAEAIAAAEWLMPLTELSASKQPLPSPSKNLIHAQAYSVEFKHVNFAYSSESPLLQDIHFHLAAGERLAIVGPSGAGKTTLLNLLMGLLTPDSGEILINDQSLSTLHLESYRQELGWLGQNPTLFAGTLADNLRFAKSHATDEELAAALKISCLWDFVQSLPQGLNSRLGERGAGLSGGQKQRLAMARAVIKNAPILLMDEPTASLDSQTEKQVLQNLYQWMQGKTVVALTHRLALVKDMDWVLVLQEGQIQEWGRPGELLANSQSAFAQLMALQEENHVANA